MIPRGTRSEGLRLADGLRPVVPNVGESVLSRSTRLIERVGVAMGLAAVDFQVARRNGGLDVDVVDRRFRLDPAAADWDIELDRIAAAVEAAVSFRRVRTMLEATGADEGVPPLWLVRGSTILDAWLDWSGTRARFGCGVSLAPGLDGAPVIGGVCLRSRRRAWRGSMNVVVRRGRATAVVCVDGRHPASLTLCTRATLTIAKAALPDTVVTALAGRVLEGREVRLADIVEHPFFEFARARVLSIEGEEAKVVIGIAHGDRPLAPVPHSALAVVPPNADPASPWRPTSAELARLDRLVDEARMSRAP